MKSAKVSGTEDGNEQSTGRRRRNVSEIVYVELSDLTEETIRHREVKATP